MKVYIVLQGNYSDKTIVAVTTTEKRAKELGEIAARSDGWTNVYIREYDTDKFNMANADDICWRVLTYKETDNVYAIKESLDGKYTKINTVEEFSDRISVTVFAPDQETAIKIAGDLKAEYLAKQENIV